MKNTEEREREREREREIEGREGKKKSVVYYQIDRKGLSGFCSGKGQSVFLCYLFLPCLIKKCFYL